MNESKVYHIRSLVDSYVNFEEDLNSEQKEAVLHDSGPALVLAGAGSGKTRVITYRVAYLVSKGISPARIFLATFTNRAAREMVRRASSLVGMDLSPLWAGTFHHLANLLLRKNASLIGYSPSFTILDREDSQELLQSIRNEKIKREDKKRFPKGSVLQDIYSFHINTKKNLEEVVLERYPDFLEEVEAFKLILQSYRRRKKELNLMDFDDLLYYMDILLNEPRVKEMYGNYFFHILVDEYQDTNLLQAEIVNKLGSFHRNIMVVGDEHQSIYSFRGARFQNILDFLKEYPETKIYTIETNYRSTPEILRLATSIISSSQFSFKKRLKPVRGKGEKPILATPQDVYQQASFVAQRILELSEEGIPLSEIAVLYRNHFHSMELQMELIRRGIPFTVRSGLRFFEQAHIKDVISFLKIIQNPKDELAWKRGLKLFPSIGEKTAHQIWERVKTVSLPLEELGKMEFKKESLRESIREIYEILSRLERRRENIPQMIEDLLDNFYAQYLEANYPDWKVRVEDVKQLARYSETFSNLEEFLSELSLMGGLRAEDIFARETGEAVILSTVHQAKGLEWKVVFIIWLAENHFPYYKSITREEIEEERRLFYVAVTRAKDYLYLLYPLTSGSDPRNFLLLRPSPFIEEIDSSSYEEWSII